MQLKAKTPLKSIKPTYRKDSIQKKDFENFIKAFRLLMEQTDKASLSSESEEHHKGLLADFLKDTFYKQSGNYINTKKLKGNSEIDLAVFLGKSATSKVGVLIEAKEQSNKSEMISRDNLHGKAFYEAVQYYLYEKIVNDNHEIKHVVITNTLEWFIFDATEFNNLFYQNAKLKKHFTKWHKGLTDSSSTKQMYDVIGEMVKGSTKEIVGTHIKLNDFRKYLDKETPEAQKKLTSLFKFFSPRHLLKAETTNDSNSLNKDFYNELLHIIGLEEIKEKGKKLIKRKSKEKREIASLLENTIVKIESRGVLRRMQNVFDYGSTKDEQLFNIGLELCITWVNRILFLKLLESQLISYHNGNKDYAFLHPDRITEFDELETLFFEILAIPTEDRSEHTKTDFPNIPYLNSSLFEPTELENRAVYISGLKDKLTLSKHSKTVLKKEAKKEISTLEYLFRFLDAYDFGIEGKEEIQEESKSLINASVLGLIFEKINGYKDGSFYTPSFITMYMCRESIRRAVTEKLNNSLEWNCKTFEDIHNYLEPSNYKTVNDVINTITICDPAVGSGHFLVSALNEIISIKAELGILLDKHGKRLKNYSIEIDNDELVVTDDDGEFLHYGFTEKGNIKKEEQRLQETLFLEKKAIRLVNP